MAAGAAHDGAMLGTIIRAHAKGRRRAALVMLLGALPWWPLGSAAEEAKPLVVVELFTSQGCSSCPPADAYLGELAKRPDVLALSFHVDYWNYIGWTDPFASRQATQRQRDYSRQLGLRYVYTPEMVVNGSSEGVGVERATIASLIKSAAAESARRPGVSIARGSDGKIKVHVAAGAATEPATLWLVGYDREHVTKVLRGENGGNTLHDYQVVRSFRDIGTWRGAALDLAVPAPDADGGSELAVLVKLGGTGRIIAAALLKSPTS